MDTRQLLNSILALSTKDRNYILVKLLKADAEEHYATCAGCHREWIRGQGAMLTINCRDCKLVYCQDCVDEEHVCDWCNDDGSDKCDE